MAFSSEVKPEVNLAQFAEFYSEYSITEVVFSTVTSAIFLMEPDRPGDRLNLFQIHLNIYD